MSQKKSMQSRFNVFYILLRFTKPEYKYLYIFNRKVIYSPKRKIDLINHLS